MFAIATGTLAPARTLNITRNYECGSSLVEVLVALMLVSLSTVATAKFLSSMDRLSHEFPAKREGLTQRRYLVEHLALGSTPDEISPLWPDIALACNGAKPLICKIDAPVSTHFPNNQRTFSVTIQ